MSSGWEVAVLIPARNEEVLLARCLESVIGAIETLPGTVKGSRKHCTEFGPRKAKPD
jgi:hypothetical protein